MHFKYYNLKYNELIEVLPYYSGFAVIYFMERYMNGMILQRERIEIDKTNMSKNFKKLLPEHIFDPLFVDIHFYFICGDKIRKLMEGFINNNQVQLFKDFWGKNKEIFKPIVHARNHLEHLHERLNSENFRAVGNFNFKDNIYTVADEKFDINFERLEEICKVFEDFLKIVQKIFGVQNIISYFEA